MSDGPLRACLGQPLTQPRCREGGGVQCVQRDQVRRRAHLASSPQQPCGGSEQHDEHDDDKPQGYPGQRSASGAGLIGRGVTGLR